MPMLLTKLMASGLGAGLANAFAADTADSQTATGTNQATAFETSTAFVRFTTVASGTGCLLDNGARGDSQVIINAGANTLSVYPHVGGTINQLAANAAFSIPAGSWAGFDRYTDARWTGSNDASLASFIQSGTGPVSVAVQDELRRLSVSPEQFGCLGDGTTVESTNMQKAATAATGGCLTLTPGKTYLAAFTLPASTDLDMRGATLKLPVIAANTGTPIVTLSGSNDIYGGGTFDGNKANQTADGFSDSYNSGTNGKGRAYRAAIIAESVADIKVFGCHFKNTFGAGMATQNCDRVTFVNNTAADLNFEFYFGSTTTSAHADYLIQGNRGYNFASADGTVNSNGILVSQADRVSITDNDLFNCERSHVKSEGGNYITIANNICRTNSVANFPAITVQQNAATNVAITGNVCSNVGAGFIISAPTLTGFVCTGNVVNTTTGASANGFGIQITNATAGTDILVSGNVMRDLKGVGCYLVTTMSRAKVVGNVFHGQATANQQGLILGGSGAADSVTIENNIFSNFDQTAGNDGVVSNSAMSAGGTYTNFVFRGNHILAGASTNRAIWLAYQTTTMSGVFENNYIDGIAGGTQPGIRNGLNYISGTNTLGSVTFGTFTCAANKDTTVTNTAVTAASLIYLQPTNAAAGTLMGAATALYISARTAATSFKVTTANAGAAAGTETFNYWILG